MSEKISKKKIYERKIYPDVKNFRRMNISGGLRGGSKGSGPLPRPRNIYYINFIQY